MKTKLADVGELRLNKGKISFFNEPISAQYFENQIIAINISKRFKKLSLKCTEPRKHRKTMKKIGRPLI